MRAPLVSICIPTYNQDEFLRKTLLTTREQSFQDFEIIVSDDSTNDRVQNLVKEFENLLPIRYFRQTQPLGSAANWNFCMDAAKGQWIKFMHHDDWWKHSDSLKKMLEGATNNSAHFIFCGSEILNVKTGLISSNQPNPTFLKELKKDPKCLFTANLIGAPTATLFKKNDLRFDKKLKYTVDIDFYIRYLLSDGHLTYVPELLIVNTSEHEDQVTTHSLNKETQVGEYAYLYNKLFKGKIPTTQIRDLFRSLFRKYKIRSQSEIIELISEPLYPRAFFSFLMLISRFR